MMGITDRDIHNTVVTPLVFSSTLMQKFNCHIQQYRPFAKQQCLSVGGQRFSISAISALFAQGRPTHISFFIMTCWIGKAVKRMLLRRSAANMSQKVLKRSKHKLNTNSTISSVCGITWIITSSACRTIRTIFRRIDVTFPMQPLTFSGKLSIQTSARTGDATGQQNSNFDTSRSTHTLAFPQCLSGFVTSRKPNDTEAVKLLSGQILKIVRSRQLYHDCYYII